MSGPTPAAGQGPDGLVRVGGAVVIVGSSIGGVRTAQALRSEGFGGGIVLVGEETELPYDKPPLSKQLLAGAWDAARIGLLSAEAAEKDHIELRLGVAAEHLDVAGRQVVLADGTAVAYDVAVIATGAAARPSPWATESGVHVVRTLADSEALAADLRAAGGGVVVVGGGFIGAEVAATARSLGRTVTVVDPVAVPMGRVVGEEVGARFADLHHRHGTETRFGVGVESVVGVAGDLTVQLTDGSTLHAGTVVVGIGAVPNDGWLASSGLVVDNGVVCDEHCRVLGRSDVWALGDVARWMHLGHREQVRVEHWTNAVDQAGCVAHNIAHPDDLWAYQPVEYVWTDQYDWRVQIVGRPARATRHQVVGDLAGAEARAAVVYTDDGERLVGAVTVNWPRALVQSRRAMAAGARFDDTAAQLSGLLAVPPRPAGAAPTPA